MDARDILLRDHATVHARRVALTEDFSLAEFVLQGASAEDMRLQVHSLNSIAWLLWHMARSEDVGVGVLVGGRPQRLDAGGWTGRLGVSIRDQGTGHTKADVQALSRAIDLDAVQAYRDDVGRATQDIVRSLPEERWQQPVGGAHVDRAVAEGAYGPAAGWVGDFCRAKTNAWALSFFGVQHNALHLGQVQWMRALASTR